MALIVIGAVLIVQPIYFRAQDRDQRNCIASNFGELSASLNARGELSRKDTRTNLIETDAARLESKANSAFYRAAFASTSQAEVFDAYGAYRVSLAQVNSLRAKVDRRRTHLAEERAKNPIPPFPAGTCE